MVRVMRSMAYFLVSIVIISNNATAGPFGIEMGQPISELEPKERGAKVLVENVPKRHPDFEHYAVWGSDETGVCLIIAISKTYENDKYGTNVRSAFYKFRQALNGRYGESQTHDVLRSGSIWNEPRDWVMSIRENERVFGATWDTPLADGQDDTLDQIEMSVSAFGSDTAVVRLQYTFKNFEACNVAIEREANDSF